MSKSRDAFRTISEVAEWLDTPAHVLRFWESKFTQVKPVKRAGGRRYYRPGDMELLCGIKKLLHDEGLTIKGVQKILREQGIKHVAALSTLPIEGHEPEALEDVPVEAAPFSDMATEPEPEAKVLNFARPYPDNGATTAHDGEIEDAKIIETVEQDEAGPEGVATVETAASGQTDRASNVTESQSSEAIEELEDPEALPLQASPDVDPVDPPEAASDPAQNPDKAALTDGQEPAAVVDDSVATPVAAEDPEPVAQVDDTPEPEAEVAETAVSDPLDADPQVGQDPADDGDLGVSIVDGVTSDEPAKAQGVVAKDAPTAQTSDAPETEAAPSAPEAEAAPDPEVAQVAVAQDTDTSKDVLSEAVPDEAQEATEGDVAEAPPIGLFSRRMPKADPEPTPEQAKPERTPLEGMEQTEPPAADPVLAQDILVLSRLERVKRLTPQQAQAMAPLVERLRTQADKLSDP